MENPFKTIKKAKKEDLKRKISVSQEESGGPNARGQGGPVFDHMIEKFNNPTNAGQTGKNVEALATQFKNTLVSRASRLYNSLVFGRKTVSPMNHTIMSDRLTLAKDGIFVMVVSINEQKKVMQKSPDIISHGFVYLRDSQELLSRARGMIRKISEEEIKRSKGGKIDVEKLKKELIKQVERYLVRETNKTPVVIPVILVV